MTTAYFGIDLHRTVIQICVLDARGERVGEERFLSQGLEEGLEAVAFPSTRQLQRLVRRRIAASSANLATHARPTADNAKVALLPKSTTIPTSFPTSPSQPACSPL